MEKKNKKLPIIIGTVAVAIIAVIFVLVIVNKGHRVIEVKSFNGAVTLERGSSEKDIVKGMHLKSKDTVTTGEDGLVELLVDADKHIVAEANTCFTITSSGNEKKGKLKIELLYGTSLIEIENKLPNGSSVEVETPNASLSVRGTTFETTYTEKNNTTVLKVTDGVVSVATDEETAEVEAGKMAIITHDEIEVYEITEIPYRDNQAFEVLYSRDYILEPYYSKELIGWDIHSTVFYKDGVYISYYFVNQETAAYEIQCAKKLHEGTPAYIQNKDGDNIIVYEYVYEYEGSEGKLISEGQYYFIKKISANSYLTIKVFDLDGGKSLSNTELENFLPLTMNCYYVYSSDLELDTGMDIGLDGSIIEDTTEEPSGTIPVGTPIAEDELPTLLRGEITYTQLEYLVRMAEEAYAADFDIENFDKMLGNIWFEPSIEGVYAPIEGTSATYDVAMLNNLLSFYSDEQISESNIPSYCTLLGNELTYSPCTVSKGDKITATINKMEYGENGEILVEYSFERKHADISLGYYTSGVSVVHLTPDENGKYMFNYIEEISSEQVYYDFSY